MDKIKIARGDDSISCENAFLYAKSLTDDHDLFSFLDKLSNETGNPDKYVSIFEYFINHKDIDIKTECMSALMLNIGRDDAYLQTMAWYYIDIKEEDEFSDKYFDIKIWSLSCLSSLHFNTQNLELAKKLFLIFSNEHEDKQIRVHAFKSVIEVYFGIDSNQISKRIGKFAPEWDDIDFEDFKEELAILKKVCSPHAT